MTKEEFSKIDKFGVDEPNEAFAKYFIGQSFLKPLGASVGVYRVNRGGGFNDFGKHLRSAYRSASNPLTKDRNLGFRIARNAGKRNAISADGNGKILPFKTAFLRQNMMRKSLQSLFQKILACWSRIFLILETPKARLNIFQKA